MQEIDIDQVWQKAIVWHQQGEKWHFHVFFPNCVFNLQNDRYALVVENRSADQTFVTYSPVGFAKISQDLLRLIYGDHILDKKQDSNKSHEKETRPIVYQCEQFIREKIPWHHHILFPDCNFNQHPGKWHLVLEGGADPQIFSALYDEEPLDDLQQLEIKYFKEIDPTF